jgi:hypothetical protein
MAGVSEDRHQDLLDRATVALEGINATFDRQAETFDRQAASFDRQAEAFDRQAASFGRHAESHELMMRRMDRRDDVLIEAISEIGLSLQRNTERLEDMGEAIRANTQAVLSVLDRLGPATG